MKPRIVNIINFIRAVEPRLTIDLYEPVFHQVRLCKQFGLPATFLLQYDALIEDRFVRLLKEELDGTYEIGGWWEIMQPLVEEAGLPWRGRYPWDWHAHVGFSTGYTPAEREKLVDVYMARFERTFGRLPRSVGSWFIDAHTLGYLADRYGVIASCNCKDQIGTDGYTLWGGYWNQAYYPSRKNSLMPAQTPEAQIPIPVFRMLGSDPIYQYECGLGSACQSVVSLEPVYRDGGGNPRWVRWFFDVIVNQPCVTFNYAQVGQENAFGWPAMKEGLTDQIEYLASLSREGRVRVETLEASARWFRENFPLTPPSAVTAPADPQREGRKAVWYNTRFYRASLYWEGADFLVRDIHMFNEDYAERYLTEKCTTPNCRYDTLPVVDGFSWSTPEDRAGIRLVEIGANGRTAPLTGGEPEVTEPGGAALKVVWPLDSGGALEILCQEDRMMFQAPGRDGWALELSWSPEQGSAVTDVKAQAIEYIHGGFAYAVRCSTGVCRWGRDDRSVTIEPTDGRIVFELDCTEQ